MKSNHTILLALISPTRAIIDCRKNNPNRVKASVLLRWNKGWFVFELIFLAILSTDNAIFHFDIFRLPAYILCIFVWCVPLSRCNEIVYAFLQDGMDKLGSKTYRETLCQSAEEATMKGTSGLGHSQRILMLLRSYAGLTFNFAVIAYLLPPGMYDATIKTPLDALYFSGTTISTLGYGDIKPIDTVSRILAIYEVFAGILLVVFALAIYVSLFSSSETTDRCN